MRRVLTALVAIPLVVAAISWAPWWVFPLGVVALVAAGYREFHRLASAQGIRTFPLTGGGFAAALAFAPAAARLPGAGAPAAGDLVRLLVAALALAVLVRVLVVPRPLEEALPSASATVLGALWLGLLPSYLVALHLESASSRAGMLYALLAAVWLGDSAAYYAGRAFGRTRLAPRISPGKTVVGLAAGVAGSVVGLALARWVFGGALQRIDVVALGVLVGLGAVAGDLAESALKRGARVKDSGRLFPGHGGVLDRVDSLLFAAPVMYHYVYGVPSRSLLLPY